MKIRSPLPCRRARIEIIPLIDIMFFLLASFMMVSLQMQKVQTLHASLPTATLAEPGTQPDILRLAVDGFGRVSLTDQGPLSFPELRQTLADRLAANTNLPVFITGSEHASHGSMIYVLDFVRRAGARRVAFGMETPGLP